ncbi:MAG: Hsp70 family protein [Proteobacteria bacterium]|nr:Hsp70 family protein [Pseudomonadota bacterium]
MPFSRAQLDAILAQVLARTRECVETVLSRACRAAGEIDVVIRTGGTSEIVAVRDLLESLFPQRVEGHDPSPAWRAGSPSQIFMDTTAGSTELRDRGLPIHRSRGTGLRPFPGDPRRPGHRAPGSLPARARMTGSGRAPVAAHPPPALARLAGDLRREFVAHVEHLERGEAPFGAASSAR